MCMYLRNLLKVIGRSDWHGWKMKGWGIEVKSRRCCHKAQLILSTGALAWKATEKKLVPPKPFILQQQQGKSSRASLEPQLPAG